MDQQMSALERYKRGLVRKQVQVFYQAIDDFRKAARDPQFAGKAHFQIALCLRSVDRDEEAIMEFRQALASPTFSAEEHRQILYLMGQTLEALGRYAESLEMYRRVRSEDSEFRDIAQRIQHVSSGGRGSRPQTQAPWHAWIEIMQTRGRQLKPHVVSLLEQTGQWFVERTESLKHHPLFEKNSSQSTHATRHRAYQAAAPPRHSQPPPRDPTIESRRHVRVPVRLRSHFSSRSRRMTGEGELRDLTPWGCRMTSSVTVPVGADLECCIFPQDAANPFIIDGATVRWISPREFGLAFTSVRPGVQRQIAQLCRARAA